MKRGSLEKYKMATVWDPAVPALPVSHTGALIPLNTTILRHSLSKDKQGQMRWHRRALVQHDECPSKRTDTPRSMRTGRPCEHTGRVAVFESKPGLGQKNKPIGFELPGSRTARKYISVVETSQSTLIHHGCFSKCYCHSVKSTKWYVPGW